VSDRAWAAIHIGGKADVRVLDEALKDVYGIHEGLAAAFARNRDAGYESLVYNGEHLALEDNEATNGMFGDLERALIKARVAFTRDNGACSGCWSSGARHFRPIPEPGESDIDIELVLSEEEGYVCIDAADIRKRLGEAESAEDAVRSIEAYLDAYAPIVPELEPLELIGSEAEVQEVLAESTEVWLARKAKEE